MNNYSPVTSQDFMWFVKYADGNIITEFDYDTLEKTDFRLIDKEGIIEYGLVGIGVKLSVNLDTGNFYILDKEVQVYLDGKQLTGNLQATNPYKQSLSTAVLGEGELNDKRREYYDTITNIVGFEFGVAGETEEVKFSLILHLISGESMYISTELVGNLKGNLEFTVNGSLQDSYEVPVGATSAELNWNFSG